MNLSSACRRGLDFALAWWRASFTLDTRGLAAFRIVVGLILVADCLLRFRTADLMFAADGVFPPDLLRDFQATPAKWSLALLADSTWWGASVLALEGLAGAWLATGLHCRMATIVAWMAVVSVVRRTEPATNAGDSLLMCLLFWSMFLPLDAAWSLAPRRRTAPRAVLSVATTALVAQVAAVYFSAGLAKWNPTWLSGEAVSYALSIHDHGTVLGMRLAQSEWLARPVTWLVLAAELIGPAVLLLVPTSGMRASLAAAFILFHVAVWATMWVGLFAPVGIAAWLPLLPPVVWNRVSGLSRGVAVAGLGTRPSLACSLALLLAAVSFLHGIGCFGAAVLPRPLRQMIVAAALEQDWPMFGTIPRQEQWVYGAAMLADGREVDLLRDGRPLERDRPAGGFTSLGTHRWHKLFWILPRPGCRVFAAPTSAALVRTWNAHHAPTERVEAFQLRFAMRIDTDREVAVQDMLLAAWPPRGEGGRGNLQRLLETTASAPQGADASRR